MLWIASFVSDMIVVRFGYSASTNPSYSQQSEPGSQRPRLRMKIFEAQQDFAHVEPDESRWPTWRQLEWPTIPPHMELTSKYTVTLPWCLTLFNQLCWSWKLLTTSNKNTRSHDIRHDITESTITALCPSQKMNLYDLSDETALHLATGSEILHRIKPFHLTTAWHRINIYIYIRTHKSYHFISWNVVQFHSMQWFQVMLIYKLLGKTHTHTT